MIIENQNNITEGRKMHGMQMSTARLLEKVKDDKKFKSIGDTIQYLLDLESELQENGKITDRYKCKKCGHDAIVTNEMAIDLHKFRHRNCKSEDPKYKDCDGALWHTYGLKDKANGTNESNGKNSGQTDVSDQDDKKFENRLSPQYIRVNSPEIYEEKVKNGEIVGDEWIK